MSAALIPIALSVIQSVIRLRGQVDTITSLHEATKPLPFLLPPLMGRKDPLYRKEMLAFFSSEAGQGLLFATGKTADFAVFQETARKQAQPENALGSLSDDLYTLYYEANGVIPQHSGQLPPQKSPGADPETVLAYYSVQSGRLSKNSVAMRVALATANTLLDVAGANAGYFVKNPATLRIVEGLVEHFSGMPDDGVDVDLVVRHLMVAAVTTVTESPGLTQDMPALRPLLGALAQVCREEPASGGGFVAGLVSAQGFSRFMSAYLNGVAADPGFLTRDRITQQVLAVTLREVAVRLPTLASDRQALLSVLEVTVAEAARHVPQLLERKDMQGRPVLTAALTLVVNEVNQSNQAFFRRIASGELLSALYRAALERVAVDPTLVLGSEAGDAALKQLVGQVAGALAVLEPIKAFSEEGLRHLASEAIQVLGNHPELLLRNSPAAATTLKQVFQAGAAAMKDLRITEAELLTLAQTALKTAAEHPAVVKWDSEFASLVPVVSEALLKTPLSDLLTAQAWGQILSKTLQAAVQHPAVWKKFRERDLVQPLATALVGVLTQANSPALLGPALSDTLPEMLVVAARYSKPLLEEFVKPEDLQTILISVVEVINRTQNLPADAVTLPAILKNALLIYLAAPFASEDDLAIQELVTTLALTIDFDFLT